MDPITTALSSYGPIGLVAAILFILYIKILRRVKSVSDEKDLQYQRQIAADAKSHKAQMEMQRELMRDYASLVQETTKAIGSLTGCMKGIACTMDEIKVFMRDERRENAARTTPESED